MLVYSDTAHILGRATETAVANVTIFIDVSAPFAFGLFSSEVLLSGEDRDHTGMAESGGGGGIDGEAKQQAAPGDEVDVAFR